MHNLESKYIHIRTLITASLLTRAKETATEEGAKDVGRRVAFVSEQPEENGSNGIVTSILRIFLFATFRLKCSLIS